MADRLAAGLTAAGRSPAWPVEANLVFLVAPKAVEARLRQALVEAADARPEEGAHLVPAGRDQPARERQSGAHVELPERTPWPSREAEFEPRHCSARPDDACQLPERAGRILDVAKEVGERERRERAVLEGKLLRGALDEADPPREAGSLDSLVRRSEHLGALVEPDDAAAAPPQELPRDRAGAGRHVEDGLVGADLDP